jgi:hypothetical protein
MVTWSRSQGEIAEICSGILELELLLTSAKFEDLESILATEVDSSSVMRCSDPL